MIAEPMIELRDISVHFGTRPTLGQFLRSAPAGIVRAVDGVSLTIAAGEVVALVGESGSGKTTTGRALVGLSPITAGSIHFRGQDVTHLRGAAMRRHRRDVQIIFQDPYESLDPKQTIGEIVSEPLEVQKLGTPEEQRERVGRSLETAGLRPAQSFLGRFPHELSGGQRQRVAIAAAMVLEPQIVVADEPVSMLDVSIRAGILRLMLDLRESRGVGYLFITHDLSLAWVISDRIAVMYLGRIVESGPAEEIVRRPRHPYTAALLSVLPSPDPSRRRPRTILTGETPDPSRIPSGCRFHPRCPAARQYGILERCMAAEPPFFPTGADSSAACWLAEPGSDVNRRAVPDAGRDDHVEPQ
jgi:oligopeptide/dipeptide ABC transporter ATP-binding protein